MQLHINSWLYIIHRREAAENATQETKMNANDNNVGNGKTDADGATVAATAQQGYDNRVFVIADEMNERI